MNKNELEEVVAKIRLTSDGEMMLRIFAKLDVEEQLWFIRKVVIS